MKYFYVLVLVTVLSALPSALNSSQAFAQDDVTGVDVVLNDGRDAMIREEGIALEDDQELWPVITMSGQLEDLWFFPGLSADDDPAQNGLVTVNGDERFEVACQEMAMDKKKGVACSVPEEAHEDWASAKGITLAYNNESRVLDHNAVNTWASWRKRAGELEQVRNRGKVAVGIPSAKGLGPQCRAYFAAVVRICGDAQVRAAPGADEACDAWLESLHHIEKALSGQQVPPEAISGMEDGCRQGLDAARQVEQAWRSSVP